MRIIIIAIYMIVFGIKLPNNMICCYLLNIGVIEHVAWLCNLWTEFWQRWVDYEGLRVISPMWFDANPKSNDLEW